MTRLIAATLAVTTLLIAGCGTVPTSSASLRQSASVSTRYLVFFIKDVKAKPAPAGAAFKFAEATISGEGSFPKTETLTLKATFKEVGGKVTVSLSREGKPLNKKDHGFYISQFHNSLLMSQPSTTEREVLEEILKFAESPFAKASR